MEIRYAMTEEDYINFNIHHINNSSSQKKMIFMIRYIIPLLAGIFIYYIGAVVQKQSKIYWMIIASLYLILWAIYYPKQHRKNIVRQIKKMLKEGDNTSLFMEKTLKIEDDTIEVVDECSSEKTLKSNISHVKIYDDMIVIYLNSLSAHVIPKRYLNRETEEFIMEYFGL